MRKVVCIAKCKNVSILAFGSLPAVAAGAGEDNRIYYITGPSAITITEFIENANEVTGSHVRYQYSTEEELYAFFDSMEVPRYTDGVWGEKAKSFPFCSAGMVTFGEAIRKDQMSFCTNDFEMLTGKKPLSVSNIINLRIRQSA